MRTKLYEKLKNKKDLLKNLLDKSISDDDIKSKVEENWLEYTPKHRDDFSVLVSDGSLSIKQYLGFYLIVFSGYGYFHDLRTKENGEWDVGDIILSVGKKQEYVKAYTSLLMFLSEIKTIYKIAKEKNPDMVIFDGTITSRLITPFPRAEWFTKTYEDEAVINLVCADVIDRLKDRFLEPADIFSLSKEVENDVVETLSQKGIKPKQDVKEAVISKLVYYEMMATISDFFKNSGSTIIVGLAKTSSGTDIFRESIPDIKLFSTYAKTLGYSAKEIPQDIAKLKSSFGEILGDLSVFLSDMDIRAFYAKYSTPTVVNLIEFFQNPDKKSVNIQDILDMLSSISIGGYPFLLKKVDNEVKITATDMEFIERELGLEKAITGRESL